jgi:hypothetical protein
VRIDLLLLLIGVRRTLIRLLSFFINPLTIFFFWIIIATVNIFFVIVFIVIGC